GVDEGLEVALERPRGGRLAEPPAQALGRPVGAAHRQLVADLVGDLEDGPGTHPAVEVVVEQDLGKGADRRLVECHPASSSRCTVPGEKAGVQTATYSAPSGPVE